MSDLSKIVKKVLKVAQTFAPMLGGTGATAVAAANALRDLIDATKGIANTPQDKAALEQELAALQARVGQRAQDFADSLRGPGGGGGGP